MSEVTKETHRPNPREDTAHLETGMLPIEDLSPDHDLSGSHSGKQCPHLVKAAWPRNLREGWPNQPAVAHQLAALACLGTARSTSALLPAQPPPGVLSAPTLQ